MQKPVFTFFPKFWKKWKRTNFLEHTVNSLLPNVKSHNSHYVNNTSEMLSAFSQTNAGFNNSKTSQKHHRERVQFSVNGCGFLELLRQLEQRTLKCLFCGYFVVASTMETDQDVSPTVKCIHTSEIGRTIAESASTRLHMRTSATGCTSARGKVKIEQ